MTTFSPEDINRPRVFKMTSTKLPRNHNFLDWKNQQTTGKVIALQLIRSLIDYKKYKAKEIRNKRIVLLRYHLALYNFDIFIKIRLIQSHVDPVNVTYI